MNLPAFSLAHKPLVLLVTVLLIAAGVFQYARAPRAEDPAFVIRDAVLLTAWPGGTAEEVERLVTDPLETALAGVAAVRKLDSTSYVGLSVLGTNYLFAGFASLLTIWVLVMGILMWRKTRSAT